MRISTNLITVIVILYISVDVDGRRGFFSSRRGSSWSSQSAGSHKTSGRWGFFRQGSSTKTTLQSSQSSGSNHDKIGWNVPRSNNNKAPGTVGINVKPPVSEHASKTSATNVKSGNPLSYSPSGGYPRHPVSNPNYNQGPFHNANAPPSGYGGHSLYGQAYNPSMHHNAPPAYSPPYGGFGGHQSFSQLSYAQPSYVQPPAFTILQPRLSGIGQMVKEALVYSSVNAGVSAAINRLIPGGIYSRSSRYSNGIGSGGSNYTEITYNNYYYDQSNPANGKTPAAPANSNSESASFNAPMSTTPEQPPAEANKKAKANASSNANSPAPQEGSNPSQPNYLISKAEVKKLSESLFYVDKSNAYKYVTVNLQGKTNKDSTGDDAPLPLLDVKPEAYEIPMIKSMLTLYDNYEMDVKTKETVTPDERKEETELLDRFLETDVFKTTMKFLADKGFILNDEYEFKDTLKHIWFSRFQRIEGERSSSGFEAVFLAEKFDSYMIGPQSWIYFAKQEIQKNVDYRGYIKDVKLANKGKAIKIRSAFNIPDTEQSVTTLLVGLSPELEMALYTVCFYLRPNDVCPVSLGGKDINLVSTRFNYFGKDILTAGFVAG